MPALDIAARTHTVNDPLQQATLTPLELAVIQTICDKYPDDQSSIAAQLSTAKVVRRENTGAGFYTYFEVQRSPDVAIGTARPRDLRDGPPATVAGLEYGMGFILWLKDGYFSNLEGYSYEESTTEIDFIAVKFEIGEL